MPSHHLFPQVAPRPGVLAAPPGHPLWATLPLNLRDVNQFCACFPAGAEVRYGLQVDVAVPLPQGHRTVD